MQFSEKISELRKSKGLTQQALAEEIGVSRQAICEWESGSAMPDPDKILALSAFFGVSTDALLKDESVQAALPEPPAQLEPQVPGENDRALPPKKSTKNSPIKRIVAAVAALALLVAAVAVPLRWDSCKELWWKACGGKIDYPYVLVHGLGGFGESEDGSISYWGATTGSLPAYLRSEGYTVCAPSIGPYSSTWDRVCELYAQLTGTTVDYGQAHAKAHNHARFGRTYTEPLVPNWGEKVNGGQRVRIHLIGHSFGGATIRMLTSLLANGDAEEMKATGKQTSALFTGGKKDWVFSVTTLCAPHNGSQLTCIVDEIGSIAGIHDTTQLLVDLMFKFAKQTSSAFGTMDLMLDQFGIRNPSGGEDDVTQALHEVEDMGTDHAFYDLSPDGAAELNDRIGMVKGVYYFSYAYSTVSDGSVLGAKVPLLTTLPILMPLALAMGSYRGTTSGGIVIDDSWLDNDGLVSVASAQYPTGDMHKDLDTQNIERGVWNVAPTAEGDHGTAVGVNADKEKTCAFYDTLFEMTASLKR